MSCFLLESQGGLVFPEAGGSGRHCSAPVTVMWLLIRRMLCLLRYHCPVMTADRANIGGLSGGWGSSILKFHANKIKHSKYEMQNAQGQDAKCFRSVLLRASV